MHFSQGNNQQPRRHDKTAAYSKEAAGFIACSAALWDISAIVNPGLV